MSRLKPSSRCRGLDSVSLCPRYFDVPCLVRDVLSWNDWSPERANSARARFLAEKYEALPFKGCIASAEERCGLLADGYPSLPLKQLGDPPGSGWNFLYSDRSILVVLI